MTMQTVVQRYTDNPLIPAIGSPHPVLLPINIGANQTIIKGTVLGQYTSTQTDVQTITMAGTSGNWSLSGVNPFSGAAFTLTPLAFNVPTNTGGGNLQAALIAVLGPGATNVAVTGTAGSSYIITFGGNLLNTPIQLFTVGQGTLAGGAVSIAHTNTGHTAGDYGPYASGNSDGTQTAKCLAKFDMATDAFGRITMGGASGGGEWGQTYQALAAYFSGWFYCQQLIGLDSTAVTALGKLKNGTTSSGILDIN